MLHLLTSMLRVTDTPRLYPVYTPKQIYKWQDDWLAKTSDRLALWRQAGNMLAHYLPTLPVITASTPIAIWCGHGESGAIGYLLAQHLHKAGYLVTTVQACQGLSEMTAQAQKITKASGVPCVGLSQLEGKRFAVHIDALLGLAVNLPTTDYQQAIRAFNNADGYKIAIDCPAGLAADSGAVATIATKVTTTLALTALTLGTLTGNGREYAKDIVLCPLVPVIDDTPVASLDYRLPVLPTRQKTAHKGSNGTVAIIGGGLAMGGAVILAGEAALACGAGKVTLFCEANHHSAVLARNPALMTRTMAELDDSILQEMDTVAFGMGLGRDKLAEDYFLQVMPKLLAHNLQTLILDADALYFLAKFADKFSPLPISVIATPHDGEAARLLACTPDKITQDKAQAIYALQARYGGSWVLKGAGTLTLTDKLAICPFGNPAMATAGMGDVLSGVIAGLRAQYGALAIASMVTIHALAGDRLAVAQGGLGILNATQMPNAITATINHLPRAP